MLHPPCLIKKRGSKARIWFNIKSDKKPNLSNKSIAILIEVSREAVRGVVKRTVPLASSQMYVF